jgi:alpha-beta hydrolase superfamily lysophospholipase
MMGDRQATFTAKHRHTHATIVIALFAILFASCYRARTECVPQLPNPSGTFAIGRLRGQHLIDSARPDRFSSDRTKYRELMVYVWYPAQQSNHPAFDPYVPGAKQIEASVCGRQRMREEFEVVWPLILSDQLRSYVLTNATPAARSGGFSVVLFSHGLGSTTFAYNAQIEDLVSHGYVVIAIEHTDMATAVLFPDGQVRCFQTRTPSGAGNGMEEMMAAVKEEVQAGGEDIRFVMDKLIHGSISVPVPIDLKHVAAIGHSAGGTMTARACQLDKRIEACISEEGELTGVSAFANYPDHAALIQPFLLMEIYQDPSDAELARMRLTRKQWKAYLQKKRQQLQSCTGGSYDVMFSDPGMVHASFSDEPLLGAPCGSERSSVALNNLLLIEKTTRAFLDKYLHDESAPMLDQPGSTPPNMTVERFVR